MRAERAFRHRLLATLAATVVLFAACGGSEDDSAPRSITVAAASDLRPAFEELGGQFTASTGTEVIFSFGSSGQLREQILNGAPFDLYASANVEFVDDIIDAGRGIAGTKADYALGRIVLWSGSGDLPTDVAALADSAYRRIAIANPDHAPYGVAAKQALAASGVYADVLDRLVYGENISDTFQIVKSGNADVAIIALSLAIADGRAYTLIPDDLHAPLEQALVVTSAAGAGSAEGRAASEFAAFVSSPAGRTVMTDYGFVLPGEALPAG